MRSPLPLALCTLLLAGFGESLRAQYGEYIRTGRPGQSIGTYCVGANTLQFQQGVTYRHVARENASTPLDRSTVSTTHVVRYGITADFEVSGVLRLQRDEFAGFGGAPDRTRSGVSNTQLGVRYNVTSETENIPSIDVQTRLLLRAQASEFRRSGVGTSTIVAIGKRLPGAFAGLINVILTHDGNRAQLQPAYTASLRYSPAQKWSLFLEGYGRLDDFTFSVDGGVGYFLSPDVKLDLFGGLEGFGDIEGEAPGIEDDFFVSAGVSWRIDWRDEK